jgi:hypothetical protein
VVGAEDIDEQILKFSEKAGRAASRPARVRRVACMKRLASSSGR